MTTTPGSPWQPPSAEELQKTLPQYEVAQMLGRGGMGAVYMGRQISLDRPVAIKILSGELEDADAGFTERFKNEAKAMAKLNHPGIVSVYDFGETEGGLLYIVMEYVDGTDVSRMIAANGRIHTEHAMAITAHVCDALAYAHERGIIHRDIKPANIMVGYDGSVKVADFGLAKVSTANGSTMGLTQSGMAMGTLHFMAPEALILGASVDHRADIYAVGVMLYQMLTGKLPQGMFKMPSLQIAGLDPRYDGIIAMAMMEDRESRFQSARDMRAGLDGILTQPVIKVEPAPAGAPSPAALPTQARPQRPGGAVRQPYRPPQSRVVVQTEKRGSLMYWVVAVALSAAVVWMVWDRNRQTAGEGVAEAQDIAAKTSAPSKTADSDPQSVLLPLPSVPSSPTAPTKPVTAPVTNAYAWLHGTWTQSHGTPPTPALSMELRSDYTAEMTAGGKTVKGRWNLSGKKLGINWANGHLHEIIVNTPDAVTELTGKGTPPQGGSFPLIYRKGVPPSVPPSASFTNSLGMKFIDVLGTDVQFCIHETRRKDYAEYASAVPGVNTQWQNPVFENVPLAVGEDHPVSQISWEEAKAFCDWLSKKEGRKYRLPTDREWSVATGLGDIEPPDRDTASVNSLNTKHVYPWGTAWPPPAGVGNFADTALAKAYPQKRILNGYSDGFATTAPVMSFKPNAVGLYDMAGNVQEFCNDLAGWGKTERIRRSSSFVDHFASGLASSMRSNFPLTSRYELTGFRCVLELRKTASTSNSSLPRSAAPTVGMVAPTMPSGASADVWVDVKGRAVSAKFVRVAGANVLLDIAGKITSVPLATLSPASQSLALKLGENVTSAVMSQLPPSYASRCTTEARMDRIRQNGGSEEIELAVTKSLAWLKTQQNADGSWGRVNKAAYTAFALQCYFARCETTEAAEYGDTVMKALMFLIEVGRRNPHGLLTEKWEAKNFSGAYEHAIATTALGEAYILTNAGLNMLPGLRESFTAAVQAIIDNQNKRGSWTYDGDVIVYKNDSTGEDLSLSNWHFQALRVARESGLNFANLDLCISQAVDYIASKQTKDGGFGSIKRDAHYNQWYLSGGAIVGLQTLAAGDKNAEIRKGVEFLRGFISAEPLNWAVNCNLYSWCHYTDAFFLAGGDDWRFFRSQLMPQMLSAQQPDGSFKKGTADWPASGAVDPIYRQCLCTLQLEVFYRLAPRY
jgi:serine/threonine protein kinase